MLLQAMMVQAAGSRSVQARCRPAHHATGFLPRRFTKHGPKHYRIPDCSSVHACKVDAGTAPEVPAHKLPQVGGSCLGPEPVHEPARLVGHQDDLIFWSHAFLCQPCEVPAEPAKLPLLMLQLLKLVIGRMGQSVTGLLTKTHSVMPKTNDFEPDAQRQH